MSYSNNFKKVVDAILNVINKQEDMHAFGMQTGTEIGVDVMFFQRGTVAIEPTLSCSGEEVEVGKEIINPEDVAQFLTSCSTSFRESYDAEVDANRKTPIIHIKKKEEAK